jgi:hypothetical protein
MLIEECLDDSDGIEILEKNPQTNSMCPFMFAAAGDTNAKTKEMTMDRILSGRFLAILRSYDDERYTHTI